MYEYSKIIYIATYVIYTNKPTQSSKFHCIYIETKGAKSTEKFIYKSLVSPKKDIKGKLTHQPLYVVGIFIIYTFPKTDKYEV